MKVATAGPRRGGRRKPGVFLDADGTLLDSSPRTVDAAGLRLVPGVGAALAPLALRGFELVVVAHRPGVAQGLYPLAALRALETRIRGMLAPSGVPVAAFQWCPHDPHGVMAGFAVACTCRKPRPGLLQSAAAIRGLDLVDSWMVGRSADDIEAGCRAGCRTILLGSRGQPANASPGSPNACATDLAHAAAMIAHAPRVRELREGSL